LLVHVSALVLWRSDYRYQLVTVADFSNGGLTSQYQ
jgi:hypothetical protein